MDIIKTYPPMNGKYAPSDEAFAEDEELEDRLADYSIGESFIYVSFAWGEAERAYELVKSLAQKHGICFFDVSSEKGDVFLPDGNLML